LFLSAVVIANYRATFEDKPGRIKKSWKERKDFINEGLFLLDEEWS